MSDTQNSFATKVEPYEVLFRRYTLRISWIGLPADDEAELEDVTTKALLEAEENITDLLPEGYYCKIEEM